ncbi:MAG: hypothetical protein ACFNS9_01140, partial [Actinomyces sp.]
MVETRALFDGALSSSADARDESLASSVISNLLSSMFDELRIIRDATVVNPIPAHAGATVGTDGTERRGRSVKDRELFHP